MTRTLGIDLGTTNSAAATLIDGKIRLITPSDGPTLYGNLFPSVVAFKKDGTIVVGKEAQTYAYSHPDRTVRWIKRRMGTDYRVNVDGLKYTPQEISALILSKIRRDAEAYLGEKVGKAVISAPAYFNNNQRNATKEAGEIAGFDVLRIISEPTASCLAYGLDKIKEKLKIAVMDLGSGTFDISILQINDGVFNVISTSGDTHLGGKDMDDLILEYIVERFEREYGVELSDEGDLHRLRDMGERTKIKLSTKHSATIDFSMKKKGIELKLLTALTRQDLEDLVRPIVDRMDDPIEQALKDSGLSLHDIDRLVLVGGPTRMPIVWNFFKGFFGIEPEKGFHPMEIVAAGSFVQAGVLEGEIRDLLLMDVTPLSLGVETSGGVFTRLIKRNTTIPTEESMVFTTQEDYQTSMAIHVLQGERAMASDNMSIGLFKLDGIPLSPKFDEEAEVNFRIDADGILHVSAKVLGTGRERKISVTGTTELTEEEVIRRILEASRFDDEDEQIRQVIELHNRVKAVFHALNQSVGEMRKKVFKDEKINLLNLLKKMEEALSRSDVEMINRYIDQLVEFMNQTSNRIRKVEQARTFTSHMKRGIRVSKSEEAEIDTMVARVEKADSENIKEEMGRLKELMILLEAGTD